MGVSKMALGGQDPRITEDTVYPFCKPFKGGVMLGVHQGLYLFTSGDTIRQTGFPDARESWEVVKGLSAFRHFIANALELGNFDLTNKGIPSLLALSYIVEASGYRGDAVDNILDSDALSSFISALFPAVKFNPKAAMDSFTINQLPSDKPLYEYKRDKVRCGIENWGILRFAARHVGFQYEVSGKTQTDELTLFGEVYTDDDDGEEVISIKEWTTFLWKRLYIMVLWEVGIYGDDISWRKEDNVVLDDFKYRSPMGVTPIVRVHSRRELDQVLDDRLYLY